MLDSITELDIQRCIDGELSDEERSQLLLRLENSDRGWRDLAIAFVENQVVSQACGLAVQPTQVRKTVSSVAVLAAPSPKRRRFAPPAWSVTVAAGVVGVGLGLLAGMRSASEATFVAASPDFAEARSEDEGGRRDNLEHGLDGAVPQPVMNMEFADASGDATHWTLPVYDVQEVGQDYWQAGDVLPEEIRRDLSRLGYRLDQERQFYSIPLDDGREIAVPVDTVQVRYTGL